MIRAIARIHLDDILDFIEFFYQRTVKMMWFIRKWIRWIFSYYSIASISITVTNATVDLCVCALTVPYYENRVSNWVQPRASFHVWTCATIPISQFTTIPMGKGNKKGVKWPIAKKRNDVREHALLWAASIF